MNWTMVSETTTRYLSHLKSQVLDNDAMDLHQDAVNSYYGAVDL